MGNVIVGNFLRSFKETDKNFTNMLSYRLSLPNTFVMYNHSTGGSSTIVEAR